jgi:hypothetical protein
MIFQTGTKVTTGKHFTILENKSRQGEKEEYKRNSLTQFSAKQDVWALLILRVQYERHVKRQDAANF